MEKYKRYYGCVIFVVAVVILLYVTVSVITPSVQNLTNLRDEVANKRNELSNLNTKLNTVKNRIKRIKNSITTSQKKVYYPIESDLGNETLFFTLYNDIIEMLHSNSIKIKSIDYNYNPEDDAFVKFGKDVYFVCDIDMDLIANYASLGKLIQDIYQYPYYLRINSLDVRPYEKDKKILLIKMGLRMYSHTSAMESVTGGASIVE